MIYKFCKTGILLGVLLLIFQSLASSDLRKRRIENRDKCLKDNNVTKEEYMNDWILRDLRFGEPKNCSRLCWYISINFLDENGNSLVPLAEEWTKDDSCKLNATEDKCVKAYQFQECFDDKVQKREWGLQEF